MRPRRFGKNHLGDRNEYLPTVHGFDEFYGNLYHLNAEEEPELPDYPKGSDFPHFRERFGPRGVMDCKATDTDDATVDPRFGRVGKQTIHDTGPLTKKRMETIDDDIAGRAVDYIKRQAQAGQPFFLWVNFTHMHFRTHVKPESRGQSGRWQSEYHDVMIDHDKNVGNVLKALDDAGIADNTFVMYSTDNGPHMNSWPDGAMTPFRNEKNTNWEGAYRVPCVVRWPGKIKPGTVSNEMVAHHDWLPTFLAMAGDPEVTDKLLKGYTIGDMTYKVHLDGYNLVPYLTGEAREEPAGLVHLLQRRPAGRGTALRQLEDRVRGTAGSPARCTSGPSRSPPFACQRSLISARTPSSAPTSLRSPTTIGLIDHVYLLVPAQAYIGEFLADLQGVSATPEGRQLQPRRRAPQAAGAPPVTQPDRIGGRRSGVPAGCLRVLVRTRRSGRWRKGCISSRKTPSSSSMRWR